MKTFKEFTNNSEKLVAGYASIGHYRPLDIPEKFPTNTPVGYFSIGNRPEVIIKNQLKETRDTEVANIIQEWIYDHGFDMDDYEKDPHKIDLQIAMANHPDPHRIKLNRHSDDLEAYYHSFNHDDKRDDFGLYTFDSRAINKHLIAHHLRESYTPNDTLARHANTIDGHLDTYSNPAPKDFHVYTGVGDSLDIKKIRDNPENGNRMYLPAYTSTSIDPTIAEQFTKNSRNLDFYGAPIRKKPYREIVRLHIPRGSTHGTYLGSTGYDGGDGHEYEYLMHRGSHIEFQGKPRIYPILSYGVGNIIVHDAKIIKQTRIPL